MEDITNKQLAKVRKDLDETIGVLVASMTMSSKMEDIEKVANYLSNGDVDFKDVVRFTKAVAEFHNKLRPILRKIERLENE